MSFEVQILLILLACWVFSTLVEGNGYLEVEVAWSVLTHVWMQEQCLSKS